MGHNGAAGFGIYVLEKASPHELTFETCDNAPCWIGRWTAMTYTINRMISGARIDDTGTRTARDLLAKAVEAI